MPAAGRIAASRLANWFWTCKEDLERHRGTRFALGASCLADLTYFTTVGVTACAGLWLSIAASGMLAIGSAIDWFQCWPETR